MAKHCKTYFLEQVHDFVVFLVIITICNCYYQDKYFYSILFYSHPRVYDECIKLDINIQFRKYFASF